MKVLFMCVANSARSQMAEGIARDLFPDWHIESAGSQPSQLNPYAIRAMQEIGIDISKHFSKNCDQLPKSFLDQLDYVITLCAEEVCPIIITGAKRLHWPIPDPATASSEEESLTKFRQARRTLSEKLKEFKAELKR